MTNKRRLRVLTHSEMSTFRDCPQRWHYRYVLGYARKTMAHALWFGIAIHAMLEAYWRARQPGGYGFGTEAHLAVALSALPHDASAYDAARLRAMVMAYAAMWNRVRCIVRHVELPFQIPLNHPVTGAAHELFERAGKIDLVIGFPNGDRLVEHKSSAADVGEGSAYRQRLILDEQLSHYESVLEAMGSRVTGIVYDVLKKPALKPLLATPEERRYMKQRKPAKPKKPTKKNPNPAPPPPPPPPELRKGVRLEDESMPAFEARLIEKILAAPQDYVFQIGVARLREQKAEWLRQVWSQAELMRFALENEHTPRNSRSCHNVYGSHCDYLDVCEGTARLEDPSRFERLTDVHPELATEKVTVRSGHEEDPMPTEPEEAA